MKYWIAWWLRLVGMNQRYLLAGILEGGRQVASGLPLFLFGIVWLVACSWWFLPSYWLVRRHRDRAAFRPALAKIRAGKIRSPGNIQDRLDIFPNDRRYQILVRAIESRRRMRKRAALRELGASAD